jgi:hypothetical protein
MARRRRRREAASTAHLWLGKERREKCGRGKRRGSGSTGAWRMRKKGAWPATVPGHGGHGSGGVALTRCVAGGGEIERGNERDEARVGRRGAHTSRGRRWRDRERK